MRVPLILAVIVLFGIGSISSAGAFRGPHQQEAQPTPRTSTFGVSRASHVAAIAAEQAGTIVELPFAEGEVVTRGAIVFRLSNRLQQLRVDRLTTLANSDLAVRRARAALVHSDRLKDRLQQLSEKNITSIKEVQDRELDAMLAKLKHEQSLMDQALIKNELEQAKVLLDQRSVRSPISGVVTQLHKQRGDTTEKLVPVLEVAQLDPLWIDFECPVRDKRLYDRGVKVELRPVARPQESRIGTVVQFAMKANASSHTFTVRVATPNEGHTWKAGLKMHIALVKTSDSGRSEVGPKPIPK